MHQERSCCCLHVAAWSDQNTAMLRQKAWRAYFTDRMRQADNLVYMQKLTMRGVMQLPTLRSWSLL